MNPGLEKLILDHMDTAVMSFDSGLCLRYLNQAAEMLLQVSARHVLGHRVADILPCQDSQVERKLIDAHASRRSFTEWELNITVADGRSLTVNCTVVPLPPGDPDLDILVELHRVDRQIRITREEQLLSQHQASQTLIRGLAHEIRNPLGGLRGAAQLLERELLEPGLREYTRIIIDEADRLQSLMNKMMGPSQLPNWCSVNIHGVLEHVRGLILAEFPNGPRVTRDYDPSIPELTADQDRLIQAFLNLARNACVAAGDTGHIEVRTRALRQFTIGTKRHRLVLRVEVLDDGPGISDGLRDKIFFPMVSGHVGGSGLGLPIAQELINQHGGLIECESRPDMTCFFVYLPLEPGHE